MPLFEHMPYTNFENLNLDWILKTIKEHEDKIADHESRIDSLEASITTISENITTIEGDITTINNNITNIENEIEQLDISGLTQQVNQNSQDISNLQDAIAGLDLTSIWNAIETNDLNSVNRDNALSARISALERATVHDIYNYYNEGNQMLFGSDLRNLPTYCLSSTETGSYPLGSGNKSDRTSGQLEERLFEYTQYGFHPNSRVSGYDYYEMAFLARYFGNRTFTLTFALAGTADNTTPTWYTHTFADASEGWNIATGCDISVYEGELQFKGRYDDWNTFFDGKYLVFLYIEYGTGSVPHEANQKPLYDAKDRLFFKPHGEANATNYQYNHLSATSSEDPYYLDELYCYGYDSVGESISYYLPFQLIYYVGQMYNSEGTLTNGMLTLILKSTNQSTHSGQLPNMTVGGCNCDVGNAFMIRNPSWVNQNTVNSFTAPIQYNNPDLNIYISGVVSYTGGRLRVSGFKIRSSGFSFNIGSTGTGFIQMDIPFTAYSQT